MFKKTLYRKLAARLPYYANNEPTRYRGPIKLFFFVTVLSGDFGSLSKYYWWFLQVVMVHTFLILLTLVP